jgi:hypothetical protein
VRDAGGEIELVLTMVDREEGATERLRRGWATSFVALQGRRVLKGVSFAPALRHARLVANGF